MAQTHLDSDSEHPFKNEWWKSLERKAALLQDQGRTGLTGGRPGEETLAEWESNSFGVRQLPADDHGILRISIGGGNTPVPSNYLVFRGPHGACVDLLRKALKALEAGPSERN
jgi:hypothetical protein